MEHTNTPWEFFEQPEEFRLGDGMDYSIMQTDPLHAIILLANPGLTLDEFRANAKHIIRCVNAYDDMLEALLARRSADEYCRAYNHLGAEAQENCTDAQQHADELAKKAIAKATGEQQ